MAYGKVEETFWHDPKIRSLTEDARHLYLYLLTSPHRNRLGCYVLDPWYAAADLQWEIASVIAALNELHTADRISWDQETRVVFIRRWLRYNTLENQKVVKAALGDLRALPESSVLPDLLTLLVENKRAHYRPVIEALSNRIANRRGNGMANGIPNDLPNGMAYRGRYARVSPEPEPEPLPEPEHSYPAVPAVGVARAHEAIPPSEQPDGFAIASQRHPAPRDRAAEVIGRVYHLGRDVVELENGYRETLEIALNRFDSWAEAKGVDPLELAEQMALVRSVEDFPADEALTVSAYLGPDRVVTRTRCEAEWLKRQGPASLPSTIDLPDVNDLARAGRDQEFEAKRAIARQQLEQLRKANA